jgi:hypothetical protein
VSFKEITDEGFAEPVYTFENPHPGDCCSTDTTYTDPTWATKPVPAAPEGWAQYCANQVKYELDNFPVGWTEVSRAITAGGTVLTVNYSSTNYAPGTATGSVVTTLSNPYTIAEAMADADALLAQISLVGAGVMLKTCSNADFTTGCEEGDSVDSAIQEDWVCAASQAFNVATQADAFAPDLAANIRAQRMWYQLAPEWPATVGPAWVVVTKSAFDCGAGTNITTTPYTKPDNETNTAGTPSTVSLDGWQFFTPPEGTTLAVITSP